MVLLSESQATKSICLLTGSANVILGLKGALEMPIYEFDCKHCKNEFEKLVFNSSKKITCPKCKSKKVYRKLSTFAFSSGGKFKSTARSSCGGCAATRCSPCGS